MTQAFVASPPAHIPSEDSNAHSPASAQLAQLLAGKAAALLELVTGTTASSSLSPGTPRNPRGRYGIDHSGAPWGTARPGALFVFSGIKSTSGEGLAGEHYYDTGDMRNPSSLRWYCQNYAQGPTAPRRRARLFVVIGNASASATVSRLTLYQGDTELHSETVSRGANTTDVLLEVSYDLPQRPGWNELRLDFRLVSGSGDPRIARLAVCQVDS